MSCKYAFSDTPCEGEIQTRNAMTQYHFDGVSNSPEDPNADFQACQVHWEEYEAHWTDMWEQYNGIIADNMHQALVDMEMERRDHNYRIEMENEARQREIEEDENRREMNRRYEEGDY